MITEKEITKAPDRPGKSALREWVDSVLFAVIAATLIRWLFFSAFVIPTPSMENTLLVGDYLFVSKLHYGATTPITPLQLPLTHQTIWGTSIPSYLDWIQLPQLRLPGFSEVKRGDVIVFNLPVEHPNSINKYSTVLPDLHPHPTDLRSNYIKRCVAIAGDRLEVRSGQVYVNGKAEPNPPRMQNEYVISANTAINEENVFHKNGITDYASIQPDPADQGNRFAYLVKTTPALAAQLKSLDFIAAIEPVFSGKRLKEPYLFPENESLSWNKDQYGPILVPKKGMTVQLNAANAALYGDVIRNYEGNEDVTLADGQVLQHGKVLQTYTFRQDYFFMMGDNRHNSADSRYWGFVPMDHIVGKAVFVWMSIDPDPVSAFRKIRWDRVFRIIE
ncbi:signal peptidase I [Dyadobacter sandarakinus]|uniref:Signal peptidase I n=1 Tax=Dyadobacter sandarakinus TaxID=2747268 RepID=A0ABX7I177_9BACT|nr:signal peptidase I [Dyadobacter sandarakinus]QRQ99602.1 signal peptidase I [Dyadobacter sandarakinus]